jgi:hypothetical protein
MNFGKTGQLLNKLEHELTNTNDLAVAVNEAVDRVVANLQKLSNLTAAAGQLTDERLSAIEQRLGIDRSDELADRWDGVLAKEFGAEAAVVRGGPRRDDQRRHSGW